MRKLFTLMFMIFVAQNAMSEIISHSEDALDKDLSFRWEEGDQKTQDKREVASDEKESEEADRDVASSPSSSDDVMFWKYEPEEKQDEKVD